MKLQKADYVQALEHLDGACNLCGIAQSFASVCSRALTTFNSTELVNKSVLIRAYLIKMAELNELEIDSREYWECRDGIASIVENWDETVRFQCEEQFKGMGRLDELELPSSSL